MKDIGIAMLVAFVIILGAGAAAVKHSRVTDCERAFTYIRSTNECLDYSAEKCAIGVDEITSYHRAQNFIREHCAARP